MGETAAVSVPLVLNTDGSVPPFFKTALHQTHLILHHQTLCRLIFVYGKLCRRRRNRCTKIRHIIRDRRIRLMPYCGNHRHPALENRPRDISSLNAHRSSIEPPPRPTIITSTSACSNIRIPCTILSAAPSPCTFAG